MGDMLVQVVRALAIITVDFVRGTSFPFVMRALSLLLAFAGLVMAVVFVAVLPNEGRLTLGDGLTFVALLLTAASFFANAGRPTSEEQREMRSVEGR